MTDKEKYAVKMAADIMENHFNEHCNMVIGNRGAGVMVGYGEAINILLGMLLSGNNHNCNCQHNSNSRDNESCCRCDSRKENREVKIVTVSDLISILDTKENRYGATGKPRMLNLSLNGNFAGSVESVKLDGYGDGLITDVTMEITSSKFTTTNADRIRNMSDEELAEFLDIVGEDGISSQYADVPCDCCCEKTECSKCWKDWLQSEAE